MRDICVFNSNMFVVYHKITNNVFGWLWLNHEITNNVFGGLWWNHEITNNVFGLLYFIMK